MIDKPHNNFFLTVFSNRKMMVDLVTQLLPDVAEQIVIDSLELDDTSYIDKELQELYSDIVYNCVSKDGEKTKVTLLFEHKSNPVQYPTLQLADYIFSIFRNNIRNKQPLSLVVPIIFYHGKTPWKYKELKDYFQNSNTFFQPYIPNFKYHVIDLTQYSDEDILSLRMSFLINSLIALKHKNDSEYVKKQPKRIFWGFEIYENTADMELLFHSLAVYIISSTNLKGKEMVEIIDTLPKESQERAKTTYENILEEGILIGKKRNEGQIKEREKIGEKRGRELTKINMAFDALKMGLEAPFVVKYFKLPKRLVEAFAKCIEDNFETTAFNTILANEIFRNFGYIRSKDIVNLTQLEMELLEKLEKNATRPKDNEENK